MARGYYTNGETLVQVKGSPQSISKVTPLGIASESIKITPHYKHFDLKVDDFGPDIPPEVLWNLTDATIQMTLVHFDPAILSICVAESACGGTEGVMISAGTPMGGGKPLYNPANHYITLYLSTNGGGTTGNAAPWKFPTAYLSVTPFMWPIGVERSLVELTWRAIPYVPQGSSSSTNSDNKTGVVTTTTTLNDILSAGSTIWTRSAT